MKGPSPAQIAIAVVEHRGQILVGQRPVGAALAGLWEFPGGKVEPGETGPQAAERECREETGLAVAGGQLLCQHEHSYEHDRVRLSFYCCELAPPATESNEPPAPKPPFRWVEREELARLEFPEGNAGVLRLLLV